MNYLDSERVEEIRILSFMWASVYFSSVIFLLVFTICVGLPRRGTPVSFKTTFTTSYSLLLGAHALSMSYQIFKGFSLESGNRVFLVAAAFSFGVSGVMYLFFSWARSSDILKNQCNPRIYRIFFTLLGYVRSQACCLHLQSLARSRCRPLSLKNTTTLRNSCLAVLLQSLTGFLRGPFIVT
ncbi:hypothetical protein BJ741DRAFT_358909 [Chytriomyces cf. hyalinus JEL632]|nr:hypothetical protein BJ741DRAFT_358909 [Chytriomyces cf. hyalinus JEL632]